MPRPWLERLRDTIADRGRELLGRGGTGAPAELCERLLTGKGEASAIAIARELLDKYRALDEAGRCDFFKVLLEDYGPDIGRVDRGARAYVANPDAETLAQLLDIVEPPRQELFRRLNMAPDGTAALVAMRTDLGVCMRGDPQLRAVDADLRHLLSSWFNRGFLNLERIDWKSPAEILEKLINYESVHEIKGWEDLRRRLARDRRCFAFFHPALPREPLIFVEVALTEEMSDSIVPLLDINSEVSDPHTANTAVFYSINNTLSGLRGISFGNFLIKQVLVDIKNELPNIDRFVTLSPLPRFAQAIRAALKGDAVEGLEPDFLAAALSDLATPITALGGNDDVLAALSVVLDNIGRLPREQSEPVLRRLALVYLTCARFRDNVYDPVAAFHLANGAVLQQINPFANPAEAGIRSAFGCMVNYLYDPDRVEANHEKFVNTGYITMSRTLAREHQRIRDQAGK